MSEMYDSMETRTAYEAIAKNQTKPKEPSNDETAETLDVSYFFRYEGVPNVYATTEREPERDDFPNDMTSVIGCAFSFKNHFAWWDKDDPRSVLVWEFNSEDAKNRGCTMTPRKNAPITSIVCASYNPDENDTAFTIGICVFGGGGKHVLISKSVQQLLQKRAKDFYGRAQDRIRTAKLIPLKIRRAYSAYR